MTEPAPQLSIVALGGLGQVGMNALVLEEPGGLVLVDCGVTFGGGELGVELYEPRFDYVLERADRLRAILLTHGHEDHIGAVPSLLRALVAARAPLGHGAAARGPHDPGPGPASTPLPTVWGPPYALELCARRLGEDAPELVSEVELRPIVPGERFRAGPFAVEPLRVTHSIVDAAALAIETVAGLVVHTGDFKLDQEPLDGPPTDEERLLALGARGVRLLLSDSTNVLAPGSSGSERSAAAALEAEVAAAEGRVVVGLFASNVHRLRALGELALRQGRRVCLLGRSARTHFEAASKLGLLAWPSELVVSPPMAGSLAHRSVLYVVTGTQAEPRSALRRLASGLHPELRIGPGDTVLLSSRAIPGNERTVFAMVDDLIRLGARVVTRQHAPGIHVSGHAHKDELARILELVRPRAFLPVHGALHHLVAHGALARDLGIAEVVVAENGVRLALGAVEPLRRVGEVPAGRVARTLGRVVPQEVLRQRLELSRSGAVVCHVVVADDGRLCAVRVAAPGSGLGAAACAALEATVVRDFVWPGRDATETELGELVRRELRRALKADFERPPHIEVLVTRLPRPSVVRSRAHAVIRQAVQAHLAVARS
ncbi:MAG: ribonuclease J, partial [Myxococcales bacterium]|nr:ribonuclease J [Myxococcales bacterium]